MDVIERARKLRKQIEEGAAGMGDEKALEFPELFPAWSGDGVVYSVGNRVRYNGVLYRTLLAHTSQENWVPDYSPSLWAKVLIVDPGTIPEWEQPISTNGYSIGDKVSFEGKIYESTIDNNVWSPTGYPAGWREVSA